MEKILEISGFSVHIKEKVTRNFREKLILSNVNITINNGDFIFLKGNNGSGKSTFLNILTRNTPLQTRYYVSGECIYYGDRFKNAYNILRSDDDIQWYKQQVCYIEQQTQMAMGSVSQYFHNVIKPVKYNLSDSDIKLFLCSHKITDLINDTSPDELINRKISSFSEGQKKIIEIFAGIMRSECDSIKLLFIDEPFNHLDVKNISRVVRLISDLRKNKPDMAIIATTHCQAFPNEDGKIKSYVFSENTITPSELPYQQGKCFKEEKLLN
jgi:ABC-type multidrug transport system ATPase subunit